MSLLARHNGLRLFCGIIVATGFFVALAAEPKRYTCVRASAPVRIDGTLDDAAWRRAAWTDWFVDIESPAKPEPRFRTRAKMLWDDDYFYVAAELQEPVAMTHLLHAAHHEASKRERPLSDAETRGWV